GIDGAVEIRRDRGAVLRLHVDAERAELRRDVGILALIKGPIRTLDDMAAGAHEPGEGAHADAGDAGEVVAHHPHGTLAFFRRTKCRDSIACPKPIARTS